MRSPEGQEPRIPQSPSIYVPAELDLIREMDSLDRKAEAKEYFGQTIFPEFLKRFELQFDTRLNPSIYPLYWPKIERGSAVADLMWDMVFRGSEPTPKGYLDTYTGKAIAIEVNPKGDLLFHSEKDPRDLDLILPQHVWIGSPDLQKADFHRAFLNSKPVVFRVAFPGPAAHV